MSECERHQTGINNKAHDHFIVAQMVPENQYGQTLRFTKNTQFE